MAIRVGMGMFFRVTAIMIQYDTSRDGYVFRVIALMIQYDTSRDGYILPCDSANDTIQYESRWVYRHLLLVK